jgi:predicted transcriptional regulator
VWASVGDEELLIPSSDPDTRILSVSAALAAAQRTFQLATQIALLEDGDLLTELTVGRLRLRHSRQVAYRDR